MQGSGDEADSTANSFSFNLLEQAESGHTKPHRD
jgi:hypothetical protein